MYANSLRSLRQSMYIAGLGCRSLVCYAAAVMADDLKEFVHERFRRTDEKLDKLFDVVAEMRTTQAGMLQILAAIDARQLRMEARLDRIEKRLDLVDAPTG